MRLVDKLFSWVLVDSNSILYVSWAKMIITDWNKIKISDFEKNSISKMLKILSTKHITLNESSTSSPSQTVTKMLMAEMCGDIVMLMIIISNFSPTHSVTTGDGHQHWCKQSNLDQWFWRFGNDFPILLRKWIFHRHA